jgi:hypothetical protein
MKTLNFSYRGLIHTLLIALACIFNVSGTHAEVKHQVYASFVFEIHWPSIGLITKKTKTQKVTNCPPREKYSIRNSRKHTRGCYKFK